MAFLITDIILCCIGGSQIMTKIAIWCRHDGDNIIGIGANIPWHISSDFKRFRRITEGQNIVCGQITYESFPNRTLPNRKIYVLTFDENYIVSAPENHFVVNNIRELKDFEEPLYICGGASIYKLFMQKQAPEIIIDSCFHGSLDPELNGAPVDISECIAKMQKDYRRISPDYDEDDITTTIWVKKGEFVPQEVLKHITLAIINQQKKD